MKFECTTEQLSSAVSVAVRFIERRVNLPVLSSILITAEKPGRIILRATNLECGVEITVQAKVTEEGVVAVPGATLSGLLGNIRTKTITAALVGEVLKVETERTNASLKTLPHDDFPILPHVSASSSFTIKASDLNRAIRNVAYCASTSAIKPELQSVLAYAEMGKFTTAATDSFRLAEKMIAARQFQGHIANEVLVEACAYDHLKKNLSNNGRQMLINYTHIRVSLVVFLQSIHEML